MAFCLISAKAATPLPRAVRPAAQRAPFFLEQARRFSLLRVSNGRTLGATFKTVYSVPKSAVTVHASATGHFKCACGERLMFGTERAHSPCSSLSVGSTAGRLGVVLDVGKSMRFQGGLLR